MAQLLRAVVPLDGWIGGPGCNVWHFSAGVGSSPEEGWPANLTEGVETRLEQFYNLVKSFLVPAVSIDLGQPWQIIDVASGNTVDEVTPPGGITITAAGSTVSGDVSRAQQAGVTLRTDIWRNGRRLTGRKFIGPTNNTLTNDTGQVASTTRATLEDAFVAMTTGLGVRLAVYHRPAKGASSGGYYGDVVSVRAMNRPATLRRRRD